MSRDFVENVDSCEQQNYFDENTVFNIILGDLSKIRSFLFSKREDYILDLYVYSEDCCQNIGMTVLGNLMEYIDEGFVKAFGEIAVLENRAIDVLNRNYPNLPKAEEHINMAEFLTDIFIELSDKPEFKNKIKSYLIRAKEKGMIYKEEADSMIEKLESCDFSGVKEHE